MKPHADHHLYTSENAVGDAIQCLVPLGVAPQKAFRDAFPDYDGAETSWQAMVSGSTLKRYCEAREKTVDTDEMARCEAIYAVYPRKIGKPAALRAIKKALQVTGFDGLLSLTKLYADAVALWAESEKCYIPYAQKWFNDARYNDATATWRRGLERGQRGEQPDHESGF